MMKIIFGSRTLQLTPYERHNEPDYYDWISVWIEYSLPEFKTLYKAAFTVYELSQLRTGLTNIYQSMLTSTESPPVHFNSMERMMDISFMKNYPEHVEVNLVLRPEDHAESIVVTDTFYLDHSYFPALLSGLDQIINWQN
ncbi:WapI family immunity protein [Atlantibacter hermannii]|uniref:WapI family immunity protein n=1 Tax=Atlantibacter hermannii TaxID=565 RepID=UPI001932C17E|nr:hypothetical protein [Atlantibacter hermannii]MBL7636479.1 hypothetical protein [Atlantibacter hermannii]MBL7675780.1 hypothetical protein [Atlantibacter hermannii]